MAILVALHHVTRYRYDRSVNMAPHVVRLRPCPHGRTPIHAYSLKIHPEKHFINWQQDPYSNYLARLIFPEPATKLRVEVDLVAEMTVVNPFDFFVEPSAEFSPFRYDPTLRKELEPYLQVADATPRLRWLVEKLRRREIRNIDYLVEINQHLNQDLKYAIRLEPGVQSPEETLTLKKGSCRDFSWLMVNLLRHLGFAARFVSGYLIQLKSDVKSLDGPSGPAEDFTDLHAWAEVYLPGAGWIGLDATSGLFTGEGHIPLACTAEPSSAAPISGDLDDCEVEFDVTMSVERIHEDPRVTKPYTAEQWQEILDLGRRVDSQLDSDDVRLTMGGEPTFVSIDDMDGAEWNTTAVGPKKRLLAEDLLQRLRQRWAKGGLLHFGQGKWYPGESLPRWAMSCYWRKDGQPLWENPALVADLRKPRGDGEVEAQAFITALARRLEVDESYALPGFEDTWYYLWKERRLPVNVDPFESQLENAEDRARLAKVFEQGLSKVVGYALPLRPGELEGTWDSNPFFLRSERMYLLPGDSPMGLRLPLDSLPWVAAKDASWDLPHDPQDQWHPLQPYVPGARHAARPGRGVGQSEQSVDGAPSVGESAPWLVRSALCVEARAGTIHVFMPPLTRIGNYLDLVGRIEQTAAELQMPMILEGYPAPFDPSIEQVKITPDPGVIEVNVQPVRTWDEAVELTMGLYEDAYLTRLGTEKFMVDGRHSGTGGGNHVVLGGPTPAESPFLRRPDLLRSLVACWHNHPSLSYLFSGLFIGPTSQAPRADEGRPDMTYELEIAMRQIPDPSAGGTMAPWLVDRVFRHLLTDLTGNTHRAEFCIDKLYSPDSASGRLGLVEFRGFEMPPHPQMSLVQQLLLRTLVTRFWKKPYQPSLIRWGTSLHDRFLLPHFVGADFADLLGEITAETGLNLPMAWFAPHMEFRFPLIGQIEAPHLGGIALELRQAIEPWYVLGEEPGGGGAVRYVDSSVERLQVLLRGVIDTRHSLTVNGALVPLHPTGKRGEFVAGVRYRAWQPPSCLHPTIPSHSPLVFDLLDRWSGRSVAGCTYHVAHPGGRAFEDFPVNACAAESRRVARFFKFGHTPGRMRLREVPVAPECPLTLDLRRC